jgi:hypothetical protein
MAAGVPRPGSLPARRREVDHLDITDLLGLDTLLAQLVLAIGAAMVVGNVAALVADSRGRRPKGAEGDLHRTRAWWLLAVGLLIALWGGLSLLAG